MLHHTDSKGTVLISAQPNRRYTNNRSAAQTESRVNGFTGQYRLRAKRACMLQHSASTINGQPTTAGSCTENFASHKHTHTHHLPSLSICELECSRSTHREREGGCTRELGRRKEIVSMDVRRSVVRSSYARVCAFVLFVLFPFAHTHHTQHTQHTHKVTGWVFCVVWFCVLSTSKVARTTPSERTSEPAGRTYFRFHYTQDGTHTTHTYDYIASYKTVITTF